MTLEEAIQELRRRNEVVPTPTRLPLVSEVDAAEETIGRKFHTDFRKYLLEASDVCVGTLEPVTITLGDHTDLRSVVANAVSLGVPGNLMPICENNADFYCQDSTGAIQFWSHNGASDEEWPSLAAWIEEVWLGENT